MTNPGSSNWLHDYFRIFDTLGEVFKARFLRPLCRRHPAYDSDSFDALALFLDGYAFARQGAKPDFSHAAVDVVRKLKDTGQMLTDDKTPQKAWDMFKEELGDQDLNSANNPLCPKGTSYERKKKGTPYTTNTNGPSILEFLQDVGKFGLPSNIITLAKYLIQFDKVKVYQGELCGINGIGTKIASLFLRDVALLYRVYPSKDRDLLQPIDVWVRRISHHWCGDGLSDKKIAEWIVEQAMQSGFSPEAVNEGMWYFGSQIAGSEYRTLKALDDIAYAKALLDERIEAIRQEASAWE